MAADPLIELRGWVDRAVAAGVTEPNGMTLATVDADGAPSARVVLLRGLDDGLVFYTNYDSPKGHDLARDPRAAAVLCWVDLSRQIRVTGTCTRVSPAESDAYWASRPPGSRLSAAASPQSSVIADAAELTRRVAALRARHPGGNVPRPAHWGGFRLRPDRVVRIHTGKGGNDGNDLYWRSGNYIWNNDKDRATLKNRVGDVIDRCRYEDGPRSENRNTRHC